MNLQKIDLDFGKDYYKEEDEFKNFSSILQKYKLDNKKRRNSRSVNSRQNSPSFSNSQNKNKSVMYPGKKRLKSKYSRIRNLSENIVEKKKRFSESRIDYGKKIWRKNCFLIIYYAFLFTQKIKSNITKEKLKKMKQLHFNIIKDKSYFLEETFRNKNNYFLRESNLTVFLY